MSASPFWVGVKPAGRPENNTVFRAEEDTVTPQNYPAYDYVTGPFKTKAEAVAFASKHVNVDGTFIDPFCNDGGGR